MKATLILRFIMTRVFRWAQPLLLPFLGASLTLGLAPFVPEPHLWQKISWLASGGQGMVWYDYFDLILHASPWVLLGLALLGNLQQRSKDKKLAQKSRSS